MTSINRYEVLPCISLWQPFASALFLRMDGARLKTHETRHWGAPVRVIGKRVAIHAAKKIDPDVEGMAARLLDRAVGENWRKILPRGAIIGTALLTYSRPQDLAYRCEPANGWDYEFGYWETSRWAWRMDEPQLFAEPIPWKGQQGWFNVEVLP